MKIKLSGMMMLVSMCFFGINAFAAAASASASDDVYFKKGDVELGFQGSYNNLSLSPNSGSTVKSQNVDFYYATLDSSYYVIDNLSIGVGTVWFYVPPTQGIKFSAFGLEGNVRYHYQLNRRFIPYIGVQAAGYFTKASDSVTSSSDTTTSYGAQLGFKIPINDHVYFDTQLKWNKYNLPASIALDMQSTQVLLGLKIKL